MYKTPMQPNVIMSIFHNSTTLNLIVTFSANAEVMCPLCSNAQRKCHCWLDYACVLERHYKKKEQLSSHLFGDLWQSKPAEREREREREPERERYKEAYFVIFACLWSCDLNTLQLDWCYVCVCVNRPSLWETTRRWEWELIMKSEPIQPVLAFGINL